MGRHTAAVWHALLGCQSVRPRLRFQASSTELLADRGYAKLRIVDITKRAAVSNNTFYELFASKEDCACAAYDHFVEVIVRKAYGAGLSTSKTWREFIQASVDGYFNALMADPVVARAFQLEMDAIGPKARQRRKERGGAIRSRAHPGSGRAPEGRPTAQKAALQRSPSIGLRGAPVGLRRSGNLKNAELREAGPRAREQS